MSLAVALREINKRQKETTLYIPKAPFVRLVREITHDIWLKDARFQAQALEALQEAATYALVQLFQGT